MEISPVYPETCKEEDQQGTVYVDFFIDKKGNVTEAYIKRGVTKLLDNAALDAVVKSKWTPARNGLDPIGVWQTVPVRYKLSNEIRAQNN